MEDSKILISKTPLRISFFGGRTDLKNFYCKSNGFVINTTIDKYIYITLSKRYDNKIAITYLDQQEIVDNINQIKSAIIQACFSLYPTYGINLNIISEVPEGKGLASSSCLTVGLINILSHYNQQYLSKEELAKQACHVEINMLKSPIGKQDQYACAYGGFNAFTFFSDEEVSHSPIILTNEQLNDSLILFDTGLKRDGNKIFKKSNKNNNYLELSKIKEQALKVYNNINTPGDWFGKELDLAWQIKRKLSNNISNFQIDNYYKQIKQAGGIGVKLLGAGGGGFFLVYTNPNLIEPMKNKLPLKALDFRFENNGSVVYEI